MMRLAKIPFFVLALVATSTTAIRAEMLPTLSIRYMAIQSDVIVVGEPVGVYGEHLPVKFRVTKVFKGPATLSEQEIVLKEEGHYALSPEYWRHKDAKEPPPRIKKALLFLKSPKAEKAETRYGTVLSGMRALTVKGDVLVPQQIMNPGPQYLLPAKEEDWDAMLDRVRKDLPQIEEILNLEKIEDRAKRNQAIFSWIEDHRDEFGGGYFGIQKKGWASLESALFDWIMESCIPEDCWKGIELASALGTSPQKSHPSFCSKEGRALLISKVFDKDLPDEQRLMALDELGSGRTFWYAHRSHYPTTRVVELDEQQDVIGRLLPLLKHKEAPWRAASARCLMSICRPYDANFKEMTSKRAIPEFVALYQSERNKEVRDIVVQAIRLIESETFWKKLTGNPEGILVLLRCSDINQEVLEFQVNIKRTHAKITGIPVFRFQELQADGSPIRTILVNPAMKSPKDLFVKGWVDWQGMVIMTVPRSQIKPGLWRVTVEGQLGKETWRSEPIEISVPQPKENE